MDLSQRLEKETLEKDLAARQKDYESVSDKLRWETNPITINSLQADQEKIINEIKKLEQELNNCYVSINEDSIKKLKTILQKYFEEENNSIKKAHGLSLPERSTSREAYESLETIISSLLVPKPENEKYSYLQKFAVYLLLDNNLNYQLKSKLNGWLENQLNSDEYSSLVQELKEELKKESNKEINPVLMVAISEQEGRYVLEAWLLKNLVTNKQYSSGDFNPITMNKGLIIPIDKNLNDVPRLLKYLIEKCQDDLEQIQIFLPANLMNHRVDCWKIENHELARTIGEDYEVLLRCSERLRGKDKSVKKWYKKRDYLKSKLNQPAQNIFKLSNSNNPKKFLMELLKDEDDDDEKLAIKVTQFSQSKQLGTIMWQGAVPLALWVRQELPDVENEPVINDILKDCNLNEVPRKVKNKRLDAFGSESPENHIGRHLCLLWDDPNIRIPEQILNPAKLK